MPHAHHPPPLHHSLPVSLPTRSGSDPVPCPGFHPSCPSCSPGPATHPTHLPLHRRRGSTRRARRAHQVQLRIPLTSRSTAVGVPPVVPVVLTRSSYASHSPPAFTAVGVPPVVPVVLTRSSYASHSPPAFTAVGVPPVVLTRSHSPPTGWPSRRRQVQVRSSEEPASPPRPCVGGLAGRGVVVSVAGAQRQAQLRSATALTSTTSGDARPIRMIIVTQRCIRPQRGVPGTHVGYPVALFSPGKGWGPPERATEGHVESSSVTATTKQASNAWGERPGDEATP